MFAEIRMTRQGLGMALLAILAAASPSAEAVVFTLEVDDVIHPVISEYIDRGLKQAEEEGAAAVIIQMNTPGGFDSSMREIIEKILRSEIPVLVFVGPSGPELHPRDSSSSCPATWPSWPPAPTPEPRIPCPWAGARWMKSCRRRWKTMPPPISAVS